ncbi:MAG: hypothetical protein WBA51_03915 [Erythrobacter sp.]
MGDSRIKQALARINAALARMDAAYASAMANAAGSSSRSATKSDADASSSVRVMTLVNSHEKLREEVADTLRDLDMLIEELES